MEKCPLEFFKQADALDEIIHLMTPEQLEALAQELQIQRPEDWGCNQGLSQ